MAKGDTKTNQYLDIAANGARADLPSDTCCETRSQTLIRRVAERIMDVEDEVEEIKNNPDVVDIVATYADLQDYDTSGLTDKDIIRVLEDETHDGNSTYYRWNATTNQFDFVGEISGGAEYAAGDGIDITNAVISATNTGKARVLTTDDYNYPANNPTSVALWLLEPGIYAWERGGASVRPHINLTSSVGTAIVGEADPNNANSMAITLFPPDENIKQFVVDKTTGVSAVTRLTLTNRQVVDALNSTSTTNVLSANQGKVLKDMIDALPAGGITELTTADYNYPETGTKFAIALWLLPQGEYVMGENVAIQRGTAYSATLNKGDYLWVQERSSGGTSTVSFTNGSWVFSSASDTGYSEGPYTSLSSRNILQSTGTSTTSAMSQKAVTDALNALPIGGVTELTSADYNWNRTAGSATEPYDSVALWLLDEGLYEIPASGVNVNVSAITVWAPGYGEIVEVTKTQAGTPKSVLYFFGNAGGYAYAVITISSGAEDVAYTRMLNMNDLVQTAGTGTNSVMSQNAVTSMVFADPSTRQKVQIGADAVASASYSVSIGRKASTYGTNSVAVGDSTQVDYQSGVAVGSGAKCTDNYAVAIGAFAKANMPYSVAVGTYAAAETKGEMNIGTGTQTTAGYNNSNYRLLTGLYDGQSAHDAATLAQGNTLATAAPTTATVGVLGQLYTDTTNMHTYQCTAIDTTDPSNPSYTWTQRW